MSKREEMKRLRRAVHELPYPWMYGSWENRSLRRRRTLLVVLPIQRTNMELSCMRTPEQAWDSPRFYPGALVWCVKKLGREYRDKVELALAWKCVQGEVEQGTLGGDFDRTERAGPQPVSASHGHTLRLVGTIPSEVWNRLGTRVLPKLRMGNDLRVNVDLSVSLNTELVRSMVSELRQILQDLDLEDRLRIEQV